MIERFSSWYRQHMLTPEGRVVWWEHFYVYLVVLTLVGYPLSRWIIHSAWGLVATTSLSALAGTWSYWQDIILNRDRSEPVAERDRRVPLQTRINAAFFAAALAFAWWTLLLL